jgi:cyclin-dependent kinase regulatory subunit CKS1
MVNYPAEIKYSKKHADRSHEFRSVVLPKNIAKTMYKLTAGGRLLKEAEWRKLGVEQSLGWAHYASHPPEPHILLFWRPLPPSGNIKPTAAPTTAVTTAGDATVVPAAVATVVSGAATIVTGAAVVTTAAPTNITTLDADFFAAPPSAAAAAQAAATTVTALVAKDFTIPASTVAVGPLVATTPAVVPSLKPRTSRRFPYECPQCLGRSRRKPPTPCARRILMGTPLGKDCCFQFRNSVC